MSIIISNKFDVNYDRTALTTCLIVSNALCDGFGGYTAGDIILSMVSHTYAGINSSFEGFWKHHSRCYSNV